jgi:CheY-like chemotaxis protein
MPKGRPIEVLVVEDSPEEAQLTMDALQEGQVSKRLHWVEDGEDAMSFLRRQRRHVAAPRPDLVLLDWRLPRMSGYEVLREIKEHSNFKRIPVVIMTSSDDDKDVLDAYEAHANCFITKPMDMDKFIEAVRSIEHFWLRTAHLPAA